MSINIFRPQWLAANVLGADAIVLWNTIFCFLERLSLKEAERQHSGKSVRPDSA